MSQAKSRRKTRTSSCSSGACSTKSGPNRSNRKKSTVHKGKGSPESKRKPSSPAASKGQPGSRTAKHAGGRKAPAKSTARQEGGSGQDARRPSRPARPYRAAKVMDDGESERPGRGGRGGERGGSSYADSRGGRGGERGGSGYSDSRGGRGGEGRSDRGGRGGERSGSGYSDSRGGRGGEGRSDRGGRGGERGGSGYSDSRGGRGGEGRSDRGGRGGERGGSGYADSRGGRGGEGRSDRGGRGGERGGSGYSDSRGGRGGERGGSGYADSRGGRGGEGRSDRGGRGGERGGSGYSSSRGEGRSDRGGRGGEGRTEFNRPAPRTGARSAPGSQRTSTDPSQSDQENKRPAKKKFPMPTPSYNTPNNPASGRVRAAGSARVTGAAPRLQKWLSEQGLCSRREGEQWIQEGRVAINGEVVKTLGIKVAKKDRVAVDGEIIVPKRSRNTAIILNKPTGIICTRNDPQERRTVFDLIQNPGTRLITVGRLDINSEGLLILTSDGQLAHGLMHPSREVPRVYRVKTYGVLLEEQLKEIREKGVRLEDGPTGPLEITLDRGRETGNNSWYTITLREGRNREVRRIFNHYDVQVARLIRVGYGGVELGDVPSGEWRAVTVDEWNKLQKAAKLPKHEGDADTESEK
ncbi:pseudouridine synthase [Magnetococcus sp. PR-3]|uniref:pseudouridine synthase n=1 Tax=Magnetococcus sp. PR-3 TaxID=3120355 RepID=UPI002FCE4DAE